MIKLGHDILFKVKEGTALAHGTVYEDVARNQPVQVQRDMLWLSCLCMYRACALFNW